jgi:hypothetical protein
VKRARDGTPRVSGGRKSAGSASHTPLAANPTALPVYHSSGLPHIMPANAFPAAGPAQSHEPHTSSLRISSSTSNTAAVPLQSHALPQLAPNNSPTPMQQPLATALPPPAALDTPLPPPPVRPIPPFDQFTAHLVPQLKADNVQPAEIGPKIRETWNQIGEVGQDPWQRKYGGRWMTGRGCSGRAAEAPSLSTEAELASLPSINKARC